MLTRALAFLLLLLVTSAVHAQDVFMNGLPRTPSNGTGGNIESAWLDLRQTSAANSKPQAAPDWVESVTIVPAAAQANTPSGTIVPTGAQADTASITIVPGDAQADALAKTVFRIHLARPRPDFQILYFRLFFDDNPDRKPHLVARDESGSQLLQSGPLGLGVGLPTSESVIVPMVGVSSIDVEVPGDGKTVRGAYLDWMANAEVLHPISAEHRDLIPEPFTGTSPLHAPIQDTEMFGAVTATLAAETIRVGASVQQGAAFQFGIEAQPLMALLTFEVASPNIDAPPEVFLNGESLGPSTIMLPDLADPAYRGGSAALVRQMQFQYTGWLRAQKLVPASSLRVGTNDLIVVAGPGTPASAIRATQIQLKYLWDKSDYQLQTDR
jgi:hypothetical protein